MRTRALASVVFGLVIAACAPASLTPVASVLRRPASFRVQATPGRIDTAFAATPGEPADVADARRDESPAPDWLFSGRGSLLCQSPGFSGGECHQDETLSPHLAPPP